MNISKMGINDYLGKEIDCACGKKHSIEIEFVEISSGALSKVPKLVNEKGYKKPFIIADQYTHDVAGKSVEKLFSNSEIPFSSYVFEDAELVPDEHALGKLFINFDPECDLIIAVGSGTINDISRFLSHRVKTPYFIIATAPSMDGYASTVAPLIKNNLKTTFECAMPRGIIADLEIVSKAPAKMIAAGFGDVLGKFTCLADWALSAIINDEYYCEFVVDLTRKSLTEVITLREGISKGEPEAIAGLMEALVLAGLGMSFVGNSRPASGSEHHLSHFWEMRLLFANKPAVLHGIKVGLATIKIAQLYQYLREENLDKNTIFNTRPPSNANWDNEIQTVFLDAAEEVLALEQQVGKNLPEAHKERIKRIGERWDDILEVLNSVPQPETIVDYLQSVNAPIRPEEEGISQELIQQAVLYGKEIRPRYTVLQLLWDLDLLTKYSLR